MTEIFTETTENDKGIFDNPSNDGSSILCYLLPNNIPYFSVAKICHDTAEKLLYVYTNNKNNDTVEFVYNVKSCGDNCEQLLLLIASRSLRCSSIEDLLYLYTLEMINQSKSDGDDEIVEIINRLKP